MTNIIGDRKPGVFDPGLARELNEKIEAEERQAKLKQKLEPKTENKEPKTENEELESKQVIIPKIQINTDDFIQLDINGLYGNKVLISPYELLGFNNMNYENTHKKLLKNGLYMPTPEIFMEFFMQVLNAYDGKSKLFNAKGKQLSTQEITDMYKHLTTDHKDIYNQNHPGVWTWLNSKYKLSAPILLNGIWYRELILGLDESDNFITKTEQLEDFVEKDIYKDTYAQLKFNKQGLPIKEDKNQSYNQGKNIKFYPPIDWRVATFSAEVGRAILKCTWIPDVWHPALGVFGCCEATQTGTNIGVHN